MLGLRDFNYLPQIDTLVQQVVEDHPGLVIVAGLDPRPMGPLDSSQVLSSGRSTFFGILARQFLAAHPRARAVVLAESKGAVRISRSSHRNVEQRFVKPPITRAGSIDQAVDEHVEVIILDQLAEQAALAALNAARRGCWVLAQLDCVFAGGDVARHLLDLGVPLDQLGSLTWIISVQRLPALCSHCRQPAQHEPESLGEWPRRYPDIPLAGSLFGAAGCSNCSQTGRLGDVAVFDFYHAPAESTRVFDQSSLLSAEEYALRLACQGQVCIDDVKRLQSEQLRRTYLFLSASERALGAANAELQRRLTELEVANRVLQQRTESLISLHDIAQTLITSTELNDLANRISRFGHQLCGADRSMLYLFHPDGTAEILSANGWDRSFLHKRIDAMQVLGTSPPKDNVGTGEPTPFKGFPPGIPPVPADIAGEALRAGLRVPLIAQQEVVGLMIVHSTHKKSFTAGETALLQTFANQAALAIQRTGLVEALRHKVDELEAAQAELVQKERLEKELELARQVQQKLLPRSFPLAPGLKFAAHNETARRVGGDFYDAFWLDTDHIGIVIADVSDKGMAAALFMALTRSLLLAEARRELSPALVLDKVHRLLLELGEPEMFVTVFYGVVDTGTRELTYARAGHEEPILLRDGAVQRLKGKGRFLGLLEYEPLGLSTQSIRLLPGDRVILYTDGLIDAQSAEGEAFGIDRLTQLLKSLSDLGADEICARAFDTLTKFQVKTEQYDDMAMLVLAVDR